MPPLISPHPGTAQKQLLLAHNPIHALLVFAYQVAERLRCVLESLRFNEIDASLCVMTSAGIARYGPGEAMAALLARADHLLYAAKRAGRNRVVTESLRQAQDALKQNMA